MSKKTRFHIEVRIPGDLEPTYDAIEWLRSNGYEDWIDFDIDMHGGKTGYSSFYFWNKETAFEFALVCL